MDPVSRSAYKLLRQIAKPGKKHVRKTKNPIQLVDDGGEYAELDELGYIQASDKVTVVRGTIFKQKPVHKSGYYVTEKGKAYIAERSTDTFNRRASFWMAFIALVISAISLVFSVR